MRLVELFIKEDFDLTDLVYFNKEQLAKSIKEVDEYQNNIQNMKELYPIIINYLIQKNYY